MSLALLAGSSITSACASRTAFTPPPPEPPQACEERRKEFVEYVASLSVKPVVPPTVVELTVSTLGKVPGVGPVLEVAPGAMVIDGERASEREHDARVRRFAAWPTAAFP